MSGNILEKAGETRDIAMSLHLLKSAHGKMVTIPNCLKSGPEFHGYWI